MQVSKKEQQGVIRFLAVAEGGGLEKRESLISANDVGDECYTRGHVIWEPRLITASSLKICANIHSGFYAVIQPSANRGLLLRGQTSKEPVSSNHLSSFTNPVKNMEPILRLHSFCCAKYLQRKTIEDSPFKQNSSSATF
ncbi:hypothetical protein TNCV_3561561 [Trichonephila clavipes]|nr:hypothetical protein TNCV_3561561 [Trichonephila clavipes]